MRWSNIIRSMPKQLLGTTGRRVRLLRENEGLNQSELAAEVTRRGVPITNFQISAIERGTSGPSWEVAIALADALKTSLDYLAIRSEVADTLDTTYAAPEVGISEQAEELARIVDRLPPFRRNEILAHAQMVEIMDRDNERDVAAALETVEVQLQTAGLIIGKETTALIRRVLLDYTATLLGAQAIAAVDASAPGADARGRRKPSG